MKKHSIILLLSLLAVFGCAPATPELFLSDSTVAEQAIKCEKDEYKKTEYCFSPRVSKWGMPYDNHKSDVDYYFGIARHNKKAEPYIIGKFTGSEWYFLSQAVDIDGKKLNFEEERVGEAQFINKINNNELNLKINNKVNQIKNNEIDFLKNESQNSNKLHHKN